MKTLPPAKAIPGASEGSAAAPLRLTPVAWDALRLAFHGSPMIEVPLHALAQNIDGCAWTVSCEDEKPSAYIDLSHGEALGRIRAHGLAPGALDTLAEILRGTLAFDESFGAMASVASEAEAASDPIRRNLERLGIPEDFPVALANFPPGTLDFCEREGMHTLGAFLDFARGASRSVIVGGEFRDLLNAVTLVDEDLLARYLPFRPRTSGLYLIESLGHLVRPLDVENRLALARDPASAPPELRARAARLFDHFADQADRLRADAAGGASLSRMVVSLEDLSLESAVAGLLALYLGAVTKSPPPAAKPTRGWRPRWWFGKS